MARICGGTTSIGASPSDKSSGIFLFGRNHHAGFFDPAFIGIRFIDVVYPTDKVPALDRREILSQAINQGVSREGLA